MWSQTVLNVSIQIVLEELLVWSQSVLNVSSNVENFLSFTLRRKAFLNAFGSDVFPKMQLNPLPMPTLT